MPEPEAGPATLAATTLGAPDASPATAPSRSELSERFAAALQHHKAGRFGEAAAAYRQVIALDPTVANAFNNLGVVLKKLARYREAAEAYQQVIALKPDFAGAHNNLGNALLALDDLEGATQAFRRAVELDPDYADAQTNLGGALQAAGRLGEAEACYGRAIALDPGNSATHFNLGHLAQQSGRDALAKDCFRAAIDAGPASEVAFSTILVCQQQLPNYTPQERLADARLFGERVSGKVREAYSQWRCDPAPKRLRIGLVSGDLADHVVGFFLEGVLRELDPSRVEIFAYPTRSRETALSQRLKQCCSAWKPIYNLSDEQAAKVIHADAIHVLLDLSGHVAFNRLGVFAWKPAPVQASWIGYFATTGVAEMDYIIADEHLIPPEDEDQFIEKPWRLKAAGCLTPPDVAIEPNALPVLTEGVFTFGCFNNFTKVTPEVVALWSRILLAAPGARLFLKARQLQSPAAQEETRRRFAAHGVTADRLVLEGQSPREEYLRAYHRVDVALDPFPYPGATTSTEGLWMGVPVITRRGDRFLSRCGEGIAKRAGLGDWIAEDDDAYVAKALSLVADPTPLIALRASLRERVLASSLYDGAAFAKDLEHGLWKMWETTGAPRVAATRAKAPDVGQLFSAALSRHRAGALGAAAAGYRQVLELDPSHIDALNNLGVALRAMGRPGEAVAAYQKLLALKPGVAGAHNNLGNALAAAGKPEEAAASFRKAIALAPDYADAHASLGGALHALGQVEAGASAYRRAIALEPRSALAHFSLGHLLQESGDFAGAKSHYKQAIDLGADPTLLSGILFHQQSLPNYTPQERLADARRFGAAARSRVKQPFSQWLCAPDPERLRVGLVSGDLHDHVVGHFLEGILDEIDPRRLDLVAYPTAVNVTDLTKRIQPRFSAWTPLNDVDDETAARRIHADGIHILIDLSGHTLHNRLSIFAWKPAPVQATWIGYFATTGMEEIDYILADEHLIPAEDEGQFIEAPWRLAGAGCLTPPDVPVEPNAPPVLSEGVFTFGCFNSLRKLTDEAVGLWSKILLAAPNSRLFLKAPQLKLEAVRETTLRRFAAHGVAADRLLLEGPSPRDEYLKAYHRIDVALDPFPYPGATTSIEGLWMGVPVITRRGDRFLSRCGEGIAKRAGLGAWVAEDDDDYVAKALSLVADPTPLIALRAKLRQQVLASSLYDSKGAARAFEDAMWGMWASARARGVCQ